LKGAIAKR